MVGMKLETGNWKLGIRNRKGVTMILVTRKQAAAKGVPLGAWRRARREGKLTPVAKRFYRRGRYFLASEVGRVFGLPEGWEA